MPHPSGVKKTSQTSKKHKKIQAQEWKVRLDLAAAYHLVDHFGMAELIYNHISARVPGEKDAFLINPFGLSYSEITASNLVKINSKGEVLDRSKVAINPAGFIIHSAIHQAKPEIHCVLHTHSIAGMAISALPEGLQLYSQESLRFYQRVAYHDFQGIVLDPKEKKSLIKSIGSASALILRQHGLLTLGSSVAQAFVLMYYLERACQTQLALQGQKASLPKKALCEKTAQQHWNKAEQADDLIWPALKRLLDKKGSEYKK